MELDFTPYKLIRLTKKYIEQNKKDIFKSWRGAWEGSYWGEQTGFNIDEETNYTIELAEKGYSYALANEENQLIAYAMITINHLPAAKNEEERNLYESINKKYKKVGYLHELVVAKSARGGRVRK